MTSPAVNQAIIDTSVYIDNFRYGKYRDELLNLKLVVRASSVVIAELARGAVSRASQNFVSSTDLNPLCLPVFLCGFKRRENPAEKNSP